MTRGMKKVMVCAALIVLCAGVREAASDTTSIPFNSSWFTWVYPYPGAATWSGNNLTLHISSEPAYGGGAVTQTTLRPTSDLPDGIIGVSFEISESGAMLDWFGFSYAVRNGPYSDPHADEEGYIALVTSDYDDVLGPQLPLDSFKRVIHELGRTTAPNEMVIENLGADYSPFSLLGDHNPLDSYPYFWLDFRALGSVKPLDVTLSNVCWIVEYEPVPVPLPGAALLGVLGLGYSGWRLRRRSY